MNQTGPISVKLDENQKVRVGTRSTNFTKASAEDGRWVRARGLLNSELIQSDAHVFIIPGKRSAIS
jgi:hypothetical protein